MRKISYVLKWFIKALGLPFWYFIYGVSFLTYRKRHRWIFIPHNQYGFSDNCKYLFLHISENEKTIEPIWITKNKQLVDELIKNGYCARYLYSIDGIWMLLTGGIFIFDSFLYDPTYWLSGGTKKVNLWHGVGLKKADHDIKKGRLKKIYSAKGLQRLLIKLLIPTTFLNRKINYFITTSQTYKEISASAFNVAKEKILVTGYPRNDVFFSDIPGTAIGTDLKLVTKIKNFKELSSDTKVVLYMPTFRDSNGERFQEEIMELLGYINSCAKNTSIFFILKVHPNAARFFKDNDWANSDFVYIADSHSDLYPILKYVDILVTDYSSISSDYLLLDRPIIFFPYDIDAYINENREFYFDYDEYSPGHKVYKAKDLVDRIKQIIEQGGDFYKEDRDKILSIFHDNRHGGSAKKITTYIQSCYEKK
jgi:CDP-glycerol glycerophosphotransferase (TagB/SpsB family)